jgi:anti-sigma factor RsiW
VERHLTGCARCRAELAQIERLSALLRAPVAEPPEAVWQAFWPRVRGRLVAAERARPLPWTVRWFPQALAHPRLALGSAALALAIVALGSWQGLQWIWSPAALTPREVIVQSVESADPNSSVMVFSHPETELTVVWVFGLDRS